MKNALYLIVILVLSSCIEKFQVDFPDNKPKLVVESALLNIDTVNYVKLSLSKAVFSGLESDTTFGVNNKFKPISDAQISVSDNMGNVYKFLGGADSIYYHRRIFNSNLNKWENDSILAPSEKPLSKGYYSSVKLKITQGNTYFLNIQWHGQEYKSSCYVPFVPKIDTVKFKFTNGKTGKDNYYIPYLWFKDNPNTVDYYLFKTNFGGGTVWSRVILSDEFLKTEINGIDVFKGEAIDYWRNAYPTSAAYGQTYRIEMHAITKEIYDYYKVLITQFRNDGGIYTPSPASPPSNISNGALGFFRASAVQLAEDIMSYPDASNQ